MTLTIYGVHRSRARRVIWLALELGLAYRHVPVIQASRLADPGAPGAPWTTRSPEYLAINPNGRIPAIDDDGLRLFESLAINLYLVRKHGGPLAPANLQEEGLAGMWTVWGVNELEPHGVLVQRHRVTLPEQQRDEAVAAQAIATLRKPFAVLESALTRDGWLMGGRFTVADLNVAELVRYSQPARELFADFPNLQRWIATCQGRPAWREMMKRLEAEPA